MTAALMLGVSVALVGVLGFLAGVFYGYVHGRHDERFIGRQEGKE